MKKTFRYSATASAACLMLFLVSAPYAGAFEVPDTGISKCYNSAGVEIFPCPAPGQPYYGQDGNQIHNGMSYTLNAADTTFTPTQDSSTLKDNVTGLFWQQSANQNSMTWGNAQSYCASLTLGGLSDWRLPSLAELNTIMDLSGTAGSVTISSVFSGTQPAAYWTSTVDPDSFVDPDYTKVWFLDFNSNAELIDSTDMKSATHYVRCVQTGVAQ